MTLDELRTRIAGAAWFSRLGRFESVVGYQAVGEEEWRRGIARAVRTELLGENHQGLVEQWLPTTRDQPDPIREDELKALEETSDRRALRDARVAVFGLTLRSLRGRSDSELLRIGRTDLSIAARGAAGYAMRRAATEILLDSRGFWCELADLYHRGHWPFGIRGAGLVAVL